VKDGVQRLDAPFAYATGKDSDGYHTGVLIRKLGPVYFDDQSLVIHPDYVSEPPPPEPVIISPPDPDRADGETDGDGTGITPPAPPPPARKPVRYYGRVQLDPQRVTKEMDVVVEEVIQRLTELVGCDVDITVEISASKPDGFDEGIVRTVSENGRTLKFDSFEFE